MKISPAISINKKCHSLQQFLASKCEWGFPKLWSNRCCHFPPLPRQGKCWGTRGRNARNSHLPLLKLNKEIGFGTRELSCIWKEWIQWVQRLTSSHTENAKLLNLISDFDVQPACSLCCKLVYSLTPPPASWEQYSQKYWDAVYQTWES